MFGLIVARLIKEDKLFGMVRLLGIKIIISELLLASRRVTSGFSQRDYFSSNENREKMTKNSGIMAQRVTKIFSIILTFRVVVKLRMAYYF